jgi:hypothetical protein
MVRERKCANSTDSNGHVAAAQNRAACDALIAHTLNPHYADVPANHAWFKWIQFTRDKLVVTNERVPDCYAPGNLFCPENAPSIPVGYRGTMTRPQMAYYLVRGVLGDLSY